ncbi:Ig-like domain-containing protein [Candidatus Poriferisodalis sp.]|uniref:Ig-like domain-containing protein n=1 Tax=Candidatus Poriferisodalis sp. TaxID=3101277 RepID=UPI003B0219B1
MLASVLTVLLLLMLPIPSVSAQSAALPDAPSESEIEQARLSGSVHSSLPELWPNLWHAARLGTLRLECPQTVVEGDVIMCFVHEYSLVGKIWLTVIDLGNIYRLPIPNVTATASSASVPSEQLSGRFVSPGFSVESNKRWWVFVDTVDDDSCDPQPYSLEVSMAGLGQSAVATVTVLDDGDASAPGESDEECVAPVPIEVLDASASEGDDSLVFTLRATGAAPTGDVQVDYALAPGSASAGADYSDVSGTLTIPAGIRHATISVPLTDDTVIEGDESFSLTLSNPVGVVLSDASATATITDDDGTATPAPSPPAVCGDVVLVGSVRDVFDITQSGFATDHHAFIDVDVTCPDTGSPAGLPIAMSVIEGPQASLDASTYCLVQVGTQTLTASAAAAAGCETVAVARPVGDTVGGRSTHLLQIPDASVGQTHQLLVWVDADRDQTHDRGEPYQYVTADFRGRSVGGGTLIDFDLPNNFEASLVTPYSDRVSRAGQYTTLRLSLKTRTDEVIGHTLGRPVYRKDPIAGAPIAVSTLAGPSRTSEVTCSTPPTIDAPSPGYSDTCMSDSSGYVDVRFRVPPGGVSVLRGQQDRLRVWLDDDRDGRYDFETVDENQRIVTPEPSTTVVVPVAKAVSYVALGDSYSAGENGRRNFPGFVGSYSNRADTADEQCRRWDRAYPEVLQRRLLRSGDVTIRVEFVTFACVSARPQHVYDALDPLGTNTDSRSLKTGRPAPDVTGEPRQAASLAGVQGMGAVDLVTITIGGNDLSFTEILKDCVSPFFQNNDTTCDESDVVDCAIAANEGHLTECTTPLSYDGVFETVEQRVADVLTHVREIAPQASVMLLGYPYLTPVMEPCGGLTRDQIESTNSSYETFRDALGDTENLLLVELFRQDYEDKLRDLGLSSVCQDRLETYLEAFYDCQSLDAGEVLFALGSNWADNLGSDAIAQFAPGVVKVDPGEALFLRQGADDLNTALRNAASRAGVHFVDVVGGVDSSLHPSGFAGHDQCSGEPWLNGFVADDVEDNGANGKTFHPTVAGHVGYAEILWDYVRNAIRDPEVGLNEAGLPVNPDPQDEDDAAAAGSGHSGRSTAGGSSQVDANDGAESSDAEEDTSFSWGVLAVKRAAMVSGCEAAFVSAAEKVTLTAGGFAASSTVSFVGRAASAGDATLTNPTIADATADANGRVEVSWTVPAAPAASVDAAPRGYLFQATGADAADETRHAFMTAPLLAYPGTAPCATADTASTTLGQSVQARVLDNDTAPTGGSLNASSVRVRPAEGGTFAVDPATGVVTFTPDGGFWGAVEASYVVFDGWGVGLAADLVVTVDAGCTVTGTAGTVLIEGTEGDDVICVPDRDDWQAFHVIDAKGGVDVILGGAGTEWIYGGAGDDVIWGNGGDDRIVAGAGLDTIHGGAGTDSIYSVDTADTIVDDSYELVVSPSVVVPQSGPAAEDDWAWAEASQTIEIDVLGNDSDPNEDLVSGSLRITVPPTLGAAVVSETADDRRVVSYRAPAAAGSDSFSYEVCDSLGNCATARATVTVGAVCTITGTEGDDTLWGTPGDDVICGLGGDDVIHGQGGNDALIGGAGDDNIAGGQGDDVLVGGPGDDYGSGGRGDDTIWGGDGDDALYGDDGNDTVWGGDGSDNLSGNDGDDRISAGAGDDIVWGYAGSDRIWGGPGADRIWGGMGDDTLWGGAGNDALRAGVGDDVLWGGRGNDTLEGAAGTDSLHGGTGNDRIDGGDGTDVLWGGIGDDTLWGKNHDDELHGGPGADTLRGGLGDDRIWGGPGDDDLNGNNGTDHLDGGEGIDACRRAATAAGCE